MDPQTVGPQADDPKTVVCSVLYESSLSHHHGFRLSRGEVSYEGRMGSARAGKAEYLQEGMFLGQGR